MGTERGLNWTTTEQADAQARKIAAAIGKNLTGFNLIAQNIGTGFTAQLAPSIDNTSLPSGMAVFRFAQGIGQGTAMGLNLTQTNFAPTNSSEFMSVVSNLGLGIALPIAENMDVSKFLNKPSGTTHQFMEQLSEIAVAAGQGFGEGASRGMDCMKSNASGPMFRKRSNSADPNAMDLPGTVGNFAIGLSQSFLGSVNLSEMLTVGMNHIDLPKVAEGAARGIAEGTIHALSKGGGLSKVLAGDFPKELATNLSALPLTTFNDSAHGSVVSFMRGLSGEGVLLLAQMAKTEKNSSLSRREVDCVSNSVGKASTPGSNYNTDLYLQHRIAP
jgi:hypothetical protein